MWTIVRVEALLMLQKKLLSFLFSSWSQGFRVLGYQYTTESVVSSLSMSYKGSISEMWGFVIVQDVTKNWSTIQTIEWKWGWSMRTWMVAIWECLYADLWRRFALSSGTLEKNPWVLLRSGKKPCHLFLRFPIQWLKGANSNAWGTTPSSQSFTSSNIIYEGICK